MTQIQAAVLRQPDQPFSLETLELADPGPGEVLVRIVSAGICHTDMLPRAPEFPAARPIILGHEGAGVVEAVGPGVEDIEAGAHVVLTFDSCGHCANCRAGHPAYCETFFPRNILGFRLDGSTPVTDSTGQPVAARWFGQSSFATHALATARNAVPVDPSLPLEKLGPLGCGIQTGAGSILCALRVRPGTSVAIFGAGAVGLSAVMAARLAGAATIIAVDLHKNRLDLATELGATHVIHGSDDILGHIVEVSPGGLHYGFDTTGHPGVIQTAVASLRPRGVCGLVGAMAEGLTLDPMALALGRAVVGIIEGDAVPQVFIPQLLALWQQGRFPFDRLITTFPFTQIDEAQEASLNGEVVKPVLLPSH